MAGLLQGGISDLKKSIDDAAESILGQGIFGESFDKGQHPEGPAALAKVLNEINTGNWNKSLPYEFAVITDPTDLGSNAPNFTPFPLPINPSDLNQDENFAISIRPTQGGTAINNSGVKYGTLTISGTTGVAPNRGSGGVNRQNGAAVARDDSLKNRSGYEVFLRLRNWFKAYYQEKKLGPLPGETTGTRRLIFKNFKDGEVLIVELEKFTMKRSSDRPFMYDYELSFRILGRANFEPFDEEGLLSDITETIEDINARISQARGFFLRAQGLLRQVKSTYDSVVTEHLRKINLATQAALGVPSTAQDLSTQAIQETISQVDTFRILTGLKDRKNQQQSTGNVDSALQRAELPEDPEAVSQRKGVRALTDLAKESDVLTSLESSQLPQESQRRLAQEKREARELPRSFYEDTIKELEEVRNNAADAFNLGDPVYNNLFNRTPTSDPGPTKIPTDQEILLLDNLEDAIQAIKGILANGEFFKSTYPEKIERVKSRFDPGQLSEIRAQPAVKEIRLSKNTDLERIALDQLGDSTRWIEIAELNQLQPPYITQDQSNTNSQVLKPGDKLLIPQPIVDGFGATPRANNKFLTKGLTELEKNLGVDLRIDENFDLVLDNNNDFAVIKAAENAIQAIKLKLSIEKRELLEHPQLGVGIGVGEKPDNITQIRTSLIQSIASDPRFERVQDLDIRIEANTIKINFVVKLKDIDIPVPIQLKV